MQVPGGRLADRFGSLRVLVLALPGLRWRIWLSAFCQLQSTIFFKAIADLNGPRRRAIPWRALWTRAFAQGVYGGSILLGAGLIFAVPLDLLGGAHGLCCDCALPYCRGPLPGLSLVRSRFVSLMRGHSGFGLVSYRWPLLVS